MSGGEGTKKPRRIGFKPNSLSTYSVLSLITIASSILQGNWLIQSIGVFGYIILPGVAIYHILGGGTSEFSNKLAVGVALGIIHMMVVGLVVSYILPLIGVDKPFEKISQILIHGGMLIGYSIYERRTKDNYIPKPTQNTGETFFWTLLLAGTLPALAALGAERLNQGGSNDIAAISLVSSWVVLLISMIASLTWWGEWRSGRLQAAMYGACLSALWAVSMRGGWLFGWDIQKEHAVAQATLEAGRWVRNGPGDLYNSMLSITVMPAQLSSLTNLSIETILRVFYPILLSFIPVVLITAYKKLAGYRYVYLSTVAVIIAARAFPQQLAQVTRQTVAVYIFAVAASIFVQNTISPRTKKIVITILLASTAFTHYTSSYSTLLLCVFGWGYTMAFGGRHGEEKKSNPLTLPALLVIAGSVFVWNFLIAAGGGILERNVSSAKDRVEQVIQDPQNEGLLQKWLSASGGKKGSVEDYAKILDTTLTEELKWMQIDENLKKYEVYDAEAPSVVGPLSKYNNLWQLLYIGARQLILVLTAGAIVGIALRRKWTVGWLPSSMVGMFVGALVLNGAARLSTWAAEIYNPERMAVHNAVLIVIPIALGVEFLSRKIKPIGVAFIIIPALLTFGNYGLSSYSFKGGAKASIGNVGEDIERFLISDDERRTGLWMLQNIEDGVVQADRYGYVGLLSISPVAGFGVVPVMHPDYMDERAWIYATRTNLEEGRARGALGGLFSVYDSPVGAFEKERSVVYSTENSRIYK